MGIWSSLYYYVLFGICLNFSTTKYSKSAISKKSELGEQWVGLWMKQDGLQLVIVEAG